MADRNEQSDDGIPNNELAEENRTPGDGEMAEAGDGEMAEAAGGMAEAADGLAEAADGIAKAAGGMVEIADEIPMPAFADRHLRMPLELPEWLVRPIFRERHQSQLQTRSQLSRDQSILPVQFSQGRPVTLEYLPGQRPVFRPLQKMADRNEQSDDGIPNNELTEENITSGDGGMAQAAGGTDEAAGGVGRASVTIRSAGGTDQACDIVSYGGDFGNPQIQMPILPPEVPICRERHQGQLQTLISHTRRHQRILPVYFTQRPVELEDQPGQRPDFRTPQEIERERAAEEWMERYGRDPDPPVRRSNCCGVGCILIIGTIAVVAITLFIFYMFRHREATKVQKAGNSQEKE